MFRAMIKPRFFATVPCLASPFVSTHPIFFSFAIARPLVFSCFSTHFPYGDIVSPGLFVFDLLLEACWLVDRSLLNPRLFFGLRLLFYCFSFFEVQSLSGSATFGWIAFLAPALFAAIPFAQSICRFLQF